MRIIKLAAADGAVISVEQDMAEQSGTIRNILNDVGISTKPIPVPNVSGPILSKVVDYWRHHRGDASRQRPREPLPGEENDSSEAATQRAISLMDDFDHEFCRIDQGTLFDIMLAANFLDVPPLLDLIGYTVANKMKGKTVAEMRATFQAKNNFTPEQEQQALRDNAWCEDDSGRS
ncbi:hypothetical protein H4R24_004224 [Coemansia sp. RSA 988]|nr:hypothetical protein H4R24_004224 [Coemansia sp. RSA 988]